VITWNRARFVFTLSLLSSACVLMLATPTLAPVSRKVPLAILAPTLVLLFLQLRVDGARAQPSETGPVEAARAVSAVAWLFALLSLVTLCGLGLGSPAFLTAYLWREAGRTAHVALASGVVSLVLFLAFGELLDVRLYDGVLQSWL